MKNIFLLTVSILFISASFAQQIALNDSVTISLPSGFVKLTKDQALQHINKKFKNNKIVLDAISSSPSDHVYKVNDILISLITTHTPAGKRVKEDHLLELKKGFDEMFKQDTTYFSFLKNVDGKQVLTFNYIMKDIGHYNLVCFNHDNSTAVTCTMAFNISDTIEAKDIFNYIINNIRFNE